jgi:hypothetical protein
MARSSYGSRRAKTWTAEQNPRPIPRIVRLGRPANDNFRRLGPTAQRLVVIFSAVVAVLALVHWGVI